MMAKEINNFKKLRLQSGFTQEELAELIGVSRQTIYNYEQGNIVPSLQTGVKIENLFGLPIEDVFLIKV